MKFFAYIRVSTVKQGETGVSLQEQRQAIQRYADTHGLAIARWFEETVTAAKQGRPAFGKMVDLLRARVAPGALIHKIDRSARNLKDWSDLGQLIDEGIDVRFVNESLDLQSRGGRLSADIQAVVAADFIRNLREETKKGIRGRLKQGLYPMPAPLGYLNNGRAKPKTPDPLVASTIKTLFELYSSGNHSLESLVQTMFDIGLRTKSGKKVVKSVLSRVLGNPFYAGLIRVKATGDTFEGAHEPIIPMTLFERCRAVASGRCGLKGRRHDFVFRNLLRCGYCDGTLTGELQKGKVYYRCHKRDCATKGIREDIVEAAALSTFKPLILSDEEKAYLADRMATMRLTWAEQTQNAAAAARVSEARMSERLNRLTDAYVDGLIDAELFQERKKALLMERQRLKERMTAKGNDTDLPSRLGKFFELTGTVYFQYKVALPEEKRALLESVTSNRSIFDKTAVIALDSPFDEVANRVTTENGSPFQNVVRTWKPLLDRIADALESKTPARDSNIGNAAWAA